MVPVNVGAVAECEGVAGGRGEPADSREPQLEETPLNEVELNILAQGTEA